LKRDGNRPVCSDKLASMVIAGAKTSAQSFRRETGRTSIDTFVPSIDGVELVGHVEILGVILQKHALVI